MSSVIHIRGFLATDGRPEMVSGVDASIIEGRLVDVANETLAAIEDADKPRDVQKWTVRTLDGWLREVHATVTIEGHEDRPMWHRFVEPGEEWKRSERVSDEATP